MKVATLKDTVLDSSNVTASSLDEWSSLTSYVATDQVKVSYESDESTPRYPIEEYVSLTSNLDSYPPDNPTDWTLLGASNRWKMFDGSTSSQTSNSDTIEVAIDASDTNVVGLFNMDASSVTLWLTVESELITDGDCSSDSFTKGTGWSYDSGNEEYDCDGTQTTGTLLYQDASTNVIEDFWVQITFTVKNYSAGNIAGYSGGASGSSVSVNGTYTQVIQTSNTNTYVGVIADNDFVGSVDDISVKFVPKYEAINLVVLSAVDYYNYFFDPFSSLQDIIWYYPKYGNSTLNIGIDNTGSNAKCGLVVYGYSFDLGLSQYGVTFGNLDYSIKTTDSLGRTTLSQGNYAKRIDIETDLTINQADSINRKLNALRGTPALWDCNNDENITSTSLESLFLYGYYDKFDILIPNFSFSTCTIRINGLT